MIISIKLKIKFVIKFIIEGKRVSNRVRFLLAQQAFSINLYQKVSRPHCINIHFSLEAYICKIFNLISLMIMNTDCGCQGIILYGILLLNISLNKLIFSFLSHISVENTHFCLFFSFEKM